MFSMLRILYSFSYDLVVLLSPKYYFFSRSSRDYFDAQRFFPRSRQPSDDEENAKIISSSVSLSMLLIPSIKEVCAT